MLSYSMLYSVYYSLSDFIERVVLQCLYRTLILVNGILLWAWAKSIRPCD